jgi:glycosyltransferase involved in cell wall biosynthesis
VLKLEDCNFEMVIVDDGSTDRTVDILKNVNDPRISVISLESNLGANTARNAGIALARAPVIAFLDSDDLYFSGRLSEPLYILGQNPDVGVVISGFATRKGQKSGAVQLSEAIYGGDELLHLTARYILPPSTSGLTVRREALLACQGFDPFVRRMQDRDLLMRLARFTKGASSARVLWEKNWSQDGISSQLNTQYDALSSFIALHPIYNSQELDTRNYMIGRHIIALLKARQWRRGSEVYRHARRALSPKLPILPLLWWGYVKTRLARKKTKARVNAKRGIATG